MTIKKNASLLVSISLLAASLFCFVPTVQIVRADSSFTDNFDSTTLRSEWTKIDPAGGSTFSLTSSPGFLTISTTLPPDRDLWVGVNFNAPRIMQPIYGNFTIETKLIGSFNTNVQSAGIVVWKDQNNYLRLERDYRNDYQEIIFNGMINGVYSTTSPETVNPGALIHISNINPTYLRMARNGNTYSGYYSADGANWIFLADITLSTADYSMTVGLYNVLRFAPSFSVSFDYFKINILTTSMPASGDEFTATTLDSRWTKIDPSGGSTFDLSVNPGWLRITTTYPPGRDLIGSLTNAPRVMMTALSGNFTIETKISASMTKNDEGAGILIWKDASHYMRLDRMSRTIGAPVEQQILFAIDGGTWTKVTLSPNINPTYLKLVKTNNLFSAYYSSNGISWTYVADLTFNIADPVDVGLDIINVYHDDTFYADFDYFRIFPPLPGPVGYWNLNEGSGLVAYDSSGNGNHGNLIGNPSWVGGKVGKALLFDGVDDYVSVPDSPSLRVQSFSLLAWLHLPVRPYQAGHPWHNHVCIINKMHYQGTSAIAGYKLDFEAPTASDDTLVITIGDGAAQRFLVQYNSINDLTLNQWHLVAGTYDGSTAKIYIDGQLKASRQSSYTILNDNTPLCLSREVSQPGYDGINGVIDEATIYNRALSAQEIYSIYMAQAFTYSDDVWDYLTVTGPDLIKPGNVGSYTVSGRLSSAIPYGGVNVSFMVDTSSQLSKVILTDTPVPDVGFRPEGYNFTKTYQLAIPSDALNNRFVKAQLNATSRTFTAFGVSMVQSPSYSELESLVSSLQAQIASLNSQITSLQSNVSSLQSQIQTLQSEKANLTSQLSNANAQISSLQSQITSLQSSYTSSQSQVSGLQSQLQTVQSQKADLESQLGSVQADLDDANSQMADLTTQLNEANTSKSNLQTQLNGLQLSLDGTNAQLDTTNNYMYVALVLSGIFIGIAVVLAVLLVRKKK